MARSKLVEREMWNAPFPSLVPYRARVFSFLFTIFVKCVVSLSTGLLGHPLPRKCWETDFFLVK